MNVSFVIALILLIISVILIILIVVYNAYWKPKLTVPYCNNNSDCGVGQVCQQNACIEITCSTDSDCGGNGICINSFCTAVTCLSSNDCPDNHACMKGACIQIGNTCQSNDDCPELSCMNGTCVQCITNSGCPNGQGCIGNICRFANTGDTGMNLITYSSLANENGNIAAPPGYFCSTNNCGTGPDRTDPIPCSGGGTGMATLCPSSCPFCVNSFCRCTPGENLEPCRSNGDCQSGICAMTDLGQVCIPSGGECISNYNGTGGNLVCPISKPYCVNGKCSEGSLGAICGTPDLPPDLCNNPRSLGVIGMTGYSPDGMGFFCVNGTCQESPGPLNSLCTSGSCSYIKEGALVCDNNSMRCIRT